MNRKHSRSDCSDMINRLRQISQPIARDRDPIHHHPLEPLSKHCEFRRDPFAYGMLLGSASHQPSNSHVSAPFFALQVPTLFYPFHLFPLFSLSLSYFSNPVLIFILTLPFSFYICIFTTIIIILIPILALLWECSKVI